MWLITQRTFSGVTHLQAEQALNTYSSLQENVCTVDLCPFINLWTASPLQALPTCLRARMWFLAHIYNSHLLLRCKVWQTATCRMLAYLSLVLWWPSQVPSGTFEYFWLVRQQCQNQRCHYCWGCLWLTFCSPNFLFIASATFTFPVWIRKQMLLKWAWHSLKGGKEMSWSK